jgi:membrane-associated phospholipid phosphatase
MPPTERAALFVISVFLIVGIYQFYFWCQRQTFARPRALRLPVDDLIPYRPEWVWIYSCLYYPAILYIIMVIDSPQQYVHIVISFVVLLALQMAFFLVLPVTTPEEWRTYNQGRGRSERFLAFVHRFDARSNSFPSMHVSVATLTALHLLPHLGLWGWLFPALIATSCLFTKQHYVADLPAGAALGWAAFRAFQAMF